MAEGCTRGGFVKSSFCMVALFALSACACATTSTPAIKHWTVPEQIEITKEHNALPSDSILRGVLADWQRMRKESQ